MCRVVLNYFLVLSLLSFFTTFSAFYPVGRVIVTCIATMNRQKILFFFVFYSCVKMGFIFDVCVSKYDRHTQGSLLWSASSANKFLPRLL